MKAADFYARFRSEASKAIVGQDEAVRLCALALIAQSHVLLEGVPGVGKTLLAKTIARLLSLQYGRVQFTPDLMPADIVGTSVYDLQSRSFRVRQGPVFTNILLADEINRAPAKVQAALLEAMEERGVSLEGQQQALPDPFMVLATQNPIEHEGTYPLPDAQLDRFLLNVRIGYPSAEDEVLLTRQVTTATVGDRLSVDAVLPVLDPARVTRLQALAASLTVDDRVLDYAVRLARATRQNAGLARGAGPRASIALVRCARARALMSGRAFATPDDVKSVALATLRHRVSVAPELEIEGRDADSVVGDLLAMVDAPRL